MLGDKAKLDYRTRHHQNGPTELELVGRSYWHPERFLRAHQILDNLRAYPPSAVTETIVRDPHAPGGRRTETDRDPLEVATQIAITNLRRLESLVDQLMANPGALSAQYGDRVQLAAKLAEYRRPALDIETQREILKLERQKLMDEQRERRAKEPVAPKQYRAEMDEIRHVFEARLSTLNERMLVASAKLLEFYSQHFFGLVAQECAKVERIHRRCVATFIFNIDHRGVPLFDREDKRAPGRQKGTHSELAEGRSSYGPGECIVDCGEESFVSTRAWQQRVQDPKFLESVYVAGVKNKTGHYPHSADVALAYSGKVLARDLRQAGLDVSRIQLYDVFNAGIDPGWFA